MWNILYFCVWCSTTCNISIDLFEIIISMVQGGCGFCSELNSNRKMRPLLKSWTTLWKVLFIHIANSIRRVGTLHWIEISSLKVEKMERKNDEKNDMKLRTCSASIIVLFFIQNGAPVIDEVHQLLLIYHRLGHKVAIQRWVYFLFIFSCIFWIEHLILSLIFFNSKSLRTVLFNKLFLSYQYHPNTWFKWNFCLVHFISENIFTKLTQLIVKKKREKNIFNEFVNLPDDEFFGLDWNYGNFHFGW